MILTVTMNPSIDTAYQLDHLIIDDVNRVVPKKTAGGKGLNVSRVLVQLGDDVLATGLLGGHAGAYLGSLMDADNIPHRFTPIAGESRTCVAILHDGNQTELLESGPEVSAEELEAFLANYAELVEQADCVTISGSLPKGVAADAYAGMVATAAAAGKPVLLDTSGAALDAALNAEVKPTLIKPNLTEINGLLSTSFTPDDLPALKAALEADTRFASIPWVVVTMGGAGAVAFHEGRGYRVIMPNIPAVNATGSGDSTIAGFAHAIARDADDDTVLRCGNACGKLNAMDPQTGHLVIERWDEVYNAIQVNEL
ncbi:MULTISPECIES: hexose kinase [Collinsella]|uniref:hexose kinase n=1 Tax=Collinsella TaxID=102106 RepID=UPI000B3810C9|nr:MULTISPECIES: hexose kinase [Collinsella]MBM6907722.1 hexose kinase [Collinsella intestinalis]MBM6942290.1 hexose kinase [Collinsella intestinalis]OUO63324.1 tagatose-6-phosphate kinase [Collinsella sp. An268]